MVSVSEVFDLARSGERDTAVSVLKQEFQRLQSSEHKVKLCEWIASCFENLNDYEQAAEWYEMAGLLSLSEVGSTLINALTALEQYEKALSCHEQGEDEEAIEKCLQIIEELRHSYAAA
jgi:tetratricopeptide (TPR) repeat protein